MTQRVDIFIGEYGRHIYLRSNIDLSAALSVALVFTDPSSSATFERFDIDGVSVLAADLTVSAFGVLSAGRTVEYPISADEISTSGDWSVYLRATLSAGERRISQPFRFTAANPG